MHGFLIFSMRTNGALIEVVLRSTRSIDPVSPTPRFQTVKNDESFSLSTPKRHRMAMVQRHPTDNNGLLDRAIAVFLLWGNKNQVHMLSAQRFPVAPNKYWTRLPDELFDNLLLADKTPVGGHRRFLGLECHLIDNQQSIARSQACIDFNQYRRCREEAFLLTKKAEIANVRGRQEDWRSGAQTIAVDSAHFAGQ